MVFRELLNTDPEILTRALIRSLTRPLLRFATLPEEADSAGATGDKTYRSRWMDQWMKCRERERRRKMKEYKKKEKKNINILIFRNNWQKVLQ